MFTEEAKWIENALKEVSLLNGNRKAANLGSSTTYFRKNVQPHIDRHVIQPLQRKGWKINHIDFKMEDGIDIVADVTQKSFGEEFKNAFGLTICTNMLEHVEDISMVVENLWEVTKNGGYILITVPYKYKKHLDPIDNMFRPTPEEIRLLFQPAMVKEIASSIIVIKDKEYYRIKRSRFPLWGRRELFRYHMGIKHKVSGILLKVNKDRNFGGVKKIF
jgi:SAM-dependent methyltransferase